MAKNILIRSRTRNDIDRRVERVLRGLGYPEPPLCLRSVRELLRLDLEYFTASDPGILREAISRLRVAGKQVLQRPALLVDAIKKFDLRALYIPDQKRILIDSTQPVLKHRWHEGHEIGHSILPWHEGAMLGDNEHTLIPYCHYQLEAEANFAAGRLLFLQDQFDERALDYSPTIDAVRALKPIFGNTYTTTFWRCIETWGSEVPIVGMITDHPHMVSDRKIVDMVNACKHLIQSDAFAARFSSVSSSTLFQIIRKYCARRAGGPLGKGETLLTDDNGSPHRFFFESFSFYHHVLSLGIYQGARNISVTNCR